MNGIIYCIINKKNNKCYIGQTMMTLNKRYSGKWWKYCNNNYLRYSIEKYGIENFEWEILEQNITSINKLNQLEIEYASKLKTYIPNGYNIQPCGGNHTMAEETKRKLSIIKSKKHVLKNTKGEIIEINNLTDFCKKHGLYRQAILNLICGWSNYSQGYLRLDTDQSTVKMAKTYSLISPTDEIVTGTVTELRKKLPLNKWTIYNLVKKKQKKSQGWRLLT